MELSDEHRCAKRINLPHHLAEGAHNLTVTLKDIHATVVANVSQAFTIETIPRISPSGIQGSGA